MKINKKSLLFVALLCAFQFRPPAVHCQAVVHDPAWESTFISEMMNSIMQYHQMIEQYLATIRQIEGDYERFRHAINQARNFKFREVNWDGNLDPFNELQQMGRQVNSLLSSIRRAEEALTNENISLNGNSYSLFDIVNVRGEKSALSFVKDAGTTAKNAYRASAEAWENGLSPAEKQYIWNRYGISPANYKLIENSGKVTQERLNRAIANVDTSLREVQEQKLSDLQYSYLQKIMEGGDELSPAETAQLQAAIQSLTIDQIRDLSTTIKDYVSFVAWKDSQEMEAHAVKEEIPAPQIRRELSDNFD